MYLEEEQKQMLFLGLIMIGFFLALYVAILIEYCLRKMTCNYFHQMDEEVEEIEITRQ